MNKQDAKKSLNYNPYYTGNKKSNVGSSGLKTNGNKKVLKAPDAFISAKRANELKNKKEVNENE